MRGSINPLILDDWIPAFAEMTGLIRTSLYAHTDLSSLAFVASARTRA